VLRQLLNQQATLESIRQSDAVVRAPFVHGWMDLVERARGVITFVHR
jgi:hypothetical protein